MNTCVKCWVSGKVQGVWYRGNTQDQAHSMGITGYAHNLPDGRVEVLACGKPESVQVLKDWLWEGPRLAEVSDVQCQEVQGVAMPKDFSIG